nr:hypothetical protein [Clostridiales bacterium]
MQKTKKLLAVLLVLAMMFGLATAAFAATPKEDAKTIINSVLAEREEEYLEEKKEDYFSISSWFNAFMTAKISGYQTEVFTAEELQAEVQKLSDDIIDYELPVLIALAKHFGFDDTEFGKSLATKFNSLKDYTTMKSSDSEDPTISATICLNNLNAFIALGIKNDTVNELVETILSCQKADGSFTYN